MFNSPTTRLSSWIPALSYLILLSIPGAASAVDPTPFPECPDDAFVVQDVDATLFEADSFIAACPELGIEVNNIGFQSQDNFVYGIQLTPSGNAGVVRIGSNCATELLGSPTDLPITERFDAGEFSSDGATFYVHAGGTGTLYVVDWSSFTVTDTKSLSLTGNVHDWAYRPNVATDTLFGGETGGGEIAVFDVGAGTRTDHPVPGLPGGIAYGGARFDGVNRLVLYRNNGERYVLDISDLSNIAIIESDFTRASIRNDATTCPGGTGVVPECNDAYFMQDVDARLFKVTESTSLPLGPAQEICGPAVWQPLQAAGVEFNNLCFRKADGLLWGLELTRLPAGNKGLVTIDPNTCAVESLGVPANLPTDVRFDAGECSEDGQWLFVNVAGLHHQFFKIDLTVPPASMTAVNVPMVKKHPQANFTGFVHDWTFNPADGLLYGGDSSDGQLAILNPANGEREDRNFVNGVLPTGIAFGGAWFDDEGHLVLHRNDGSLFEIDVVSREILDVDSDRSSSYNDGTSCVGLFP